MQHRAKAYKFNSGAWADERVCAWLLVLAMKLYEWQQCVATDNISSAQSQQQISLLLYYIFIFNHIYVYILLVMHLFSKLIFQKSALILDC